jgi:hypothetical protein
MDDAERGAQIRRTDVVGRELSKPEILIDGDLPGAPFVGEEEDVVPAFVDPAQQIEDGLEPGSNFGGVSLLGGVHELVEQAAALGDPRARAVRLLHEVPRVDAERLVELPSEARPVELGRELIHRTKDADEAKLILRTPKAREIVEVGLILWVPLGEITYQLGKLGVSSSERAIELFERFYWNTSAFDRGSLRTILEIRAVRRAQRRAVDDAERTAALRAARSDARILAVSLPNTPFSWFLVLGRLGHTVHVREDKVLAELRAHAEFRALESTMLAGPGDEKRAAAFTSIVRDAHELHQQVAPPDAALREGLGNFVRLRTNPSKVPNIHELSDGNHTVELMPKEENNDDGTAPVDSGADEEADGECGEADSEPPSIP